MKADPAAMDRHPTANPKLAKIHGSDRPDEEQPTAAKVTEDKSHLEQNRTQLQTSR